MELSENASTPVPIGPHPSVPSAALEGVTERVPGQAAPVPPPLPPPIEPGRYLEVRGPGASLMRLQEGVTHIGRGLSADLRLDENSVSRRHAILIEAPSGARILDDRSSNGTFVNGHRIDQVDLRHGDVIVLGRVVLRFLEV